MGKEDRGFAWMSRVKQREICQKGGRASHQGGEKADGSGPRKVSHEWTTEEARDAGQKGCLARARYRRLIAEADALLPVEEGDSRISGQGTISDVVADPEAVFNAANTDEADVV